VIAGGYPAVAPVLPELLTWPVARELAPSLASIGAPLLAEVRRIVPARDDIWKYWVSNSSWRHRVVRTV
jgi:hypothetical protein